MFNNLMSFPFFHQLESADCGPACLRMIAKYYGRNYSIQYLREHTFITREGVSMLGISDAAELIGFRTIGVRITLEQLNTEVFQPCILHWNQRHFVVCYKIKKGKYYVADPASKKLVYNEVELRRCWCSTLVEGKDTGVVLLLEPGPEFYVREEIEELKDSRFSFFSLSDTLQARTFSVDIGDVDSEYSATDYAVSYPNLSRYRDTR